MKMIGSKGKLLSSTVVLLGLLAAAGCSREEETAGPEYPETREIAYSFRLQNNTGRELPMANVGLYLPMARSSGQNLLDFSVGGTLDASYRHVEDEAGNSSVFYEMRDLPADFTRTVKLKAKVGFAQTPHAIDLHDLQRYLAVPAADAAAEGAQPNMEFAAEDDTKAKLLKIAAVVSPQSAESGAAAGNDCIERLQQFTQLARLKQIAVRPVIGFHMKAAADDAEQKPGYKPHCWAEYYDEQNRWRALDVMVVAPVENIKDYLAVRSFYSLQELQQQTPASLMAEGFGLTITFDRVE